MRLRINKISLRAFTDFGPYGAEIPLHSGLNVIHGRNTIGKSTSLLAILYGLGLEGMLGPRKQPPFPSSMRNALTAADGSQASVSESYVELEIENAFGERVAVKRAVKGPTDYRLVNVRPLTLSKRSGALAQEHDFFVHYPGAASRDGGFHNFLSAFIGWQLPEVQDFDGHSRQLYIEAIFPLFFVEQKVGWSAIQGPFPTYLGLQEVARRAIEFVLDFEVQKLRQQRRDLERELSRLRQKWVSTRAELVRLAQRHAALIVTVPTEPTGEFALADDEHVQILHNAEWKLLSSVLSRYEHDHDLLVNEKIPEASAQTEALEAQLGKNAMEIEGITIQIEELASRITEEEQQAHAVERRLIALKEDYLKNQDVKRLLRLGSKLGSSVATHTCPTCQQALHSELLPTDVRHVMTVDDSIAFLKSQIDLFTASRNFLTRAVVEARAEWQIAQNRLAELRAESRSIRSTLVAPLGTPSEVEIRKRLVLEQKIADLDRLESQAEELVLVLKEVGADHAVRAAELSKLGRISSSKSDKEKIVEWTTEFQRQLGLYEFRSFPRDRVFISPESLRPTLLVSDQSGEREAELSLEASASDFVRLKWAYLLSLLKVATRRRSNHLGLLILDEPRQQDADPVSFSTLFRVAAEAAESGAQVLIATSDRHSSIVSTLSASGVWVLSYDDFLLQPLEIVSKESSS